MTVAELFEYVEKKKVRLIIDAVKSTKAATPMKCMCIRVESDKYSDSRLLYADDIATADDNIKEFIDGIDEISEEKED